MRFVQRLPVGCENRALLGGGDQADLHALAATAPPTAARRDEDKNVSCGDSFVKVAESSQLNRPAFPGDSISCYRQPFDLLTVAAREDQERLLAGVPAQRRFENWLPE